MSAERWIILRCDFIGECADRYSHDTARVTEARAEAKKHGWAHGRGKDYCPRHREWAGGAS